MKRRFAVFAVFCAAAVSAAVPDLWLGRGGVWRESAAVTVFNATKDSWEGKPVGVKIGTGENELPIAGVRIEELRLVDGNGVELEYGIWAKDGKEILKEGQAPAGGEMILPVTCVPGGTASMRVYWGNPQAWGLADFWTERPAAKDAKPFVHVCPKEKSVLREEAGSGEWPSGAEWLYRLPVRLVNDSDKPVSKALAFVPYAEVKRMLKHPVFALYGPDGVERPIFNAGGRLFFSIDIPARTIALYRLYVREGDGKTVRVKRAAASTLASDIPSDQVIVEETGMTKADEDALTALIASSANLLKNPSFEKNEGGSCWRQSGAGSKGVTFSRVKGGVLGDWCALLEISPDARPSWDGRVQHVTVEPGRTYFYGAFVKGEGLTSSVAVHEHLMDARGKILNMGASRAFRNDMDRWTPLFGTVDTGISGRKLSIHLTMNGHGRLFHDAAMVIECVKARTGDPEMRPMPRGSFAVRQFDVTEKVYREMSVDDSKDTFSIDMALNETEELQIAVRAGRKIERLTAEIAPLSGPGGAKLAIAPNFVDWVPVDHPTAYYSCRTPKWVLRKPSSSGQCDGWAGWWPDPIVPGGTCELPANTARAFRFAVKTGADTPCGVYRGEVTWKENGREIRRDAVSVTVWNFTLPERPSFPAIYDVRIGNKAWHVLGDVHARYDRIAAFMAEKKICPDSINAQPVFKRGKDGRVTADFTAYDKAAARHFDHYRFPVSYSPRIFYCFGWGHPPRKLMGVEPYEGKYPYKDVDRSKLSPAWTAVFKEALALYWNHMKEKGWADKIVLYISDEPYMSDPKIEAQMKALCKVIHEVDPTIRIYSSTWRYLESWEDSIDLWGVAHYGGFPVEHMKRLGKAGGTKGFWYTTDGQECLDTVNCSTERLFSHFCAAWGAEAYEFWGCTWLTYDPWKFGWHSYIRQAGVPGDEHWVRYPAGDGYLIYPPKKGISDDVCSSIRLEAARDGVEDFSLLQALAARTDAPAKKLLSEFRALCPIPNSGGRYSGRNIPDPTVIGKLRLRALKLLCEAK